MDIQEQIGQITKKLSTDGALLARFKSEPQAVVESILGLKLPDGLVEQVISSVKLKLAGDGLPGVAASLKKLF